MLITTDGISGSLLVFYVSPGGRISAEYNLSQVWNISEVLRSPAACAYDEWGNLVVLDYSSGRIFLYSSSEKNPLEESRSATPRSRNTSGERTLEDSSLERERSGSFIGRRGFLRRSKRKAKQLAAELGVREMGEQRLRVLHEVGAQCAIGLACHKGWCYVAVFGQKRVVAFKYAEA